MTFEYVLMFIEVTIISLMCNLLILSPFFCVHKCMELDGVTVDIVYI